MHRIAAFASMTHDPKVGSLKIQNSFRTSVSTFFPAWDLSSPHGQTQTGWARVNRYNGAKGGLTQMPAASIDPDGRTALTTSTAALRRIAAYVLPPALDRRVLDLAERKESLTPDERVELLAWVAFTQQRSIEKAEAELALRQVAGAFPDLTARP